MPVGPASSTVPEGADPFVSGNRWAHGSRAHAQDQLVVAEPPARSPLLVGTYVTQSGVRSMATTSPSTLTSEPEPVEELCRGLKGEIVLLLDQAPDEVGQSTIRERHMARALESR